MRNKIKSGQKYRHFKGIIVIIICIAKDSETLKEKVVYKDEDTNEIWVRDKDMFLSLIDREKYPNINQTYRFELIKDK